MHCILELLKMHNKNFHNILVERDANYRNKEL